MSRRLILMLTLAFLAALASFAAGTVGTASPVPQATPMPDAITFYNNTMADFSATSGEPIVKVDPKDRIFATSPFGVSTTLSLLWRSDDGGRSYRPMGAPVVRDAVTGPGGGGTSSSGTNSTSTSASALVSAVLRVTYNPLLGTATVERLK
jgi:hypothetical protein